MNEQIQAVLDQINSEGMGYHKWVQCFRDEMAYIANLWEKGDKSRLYINDADRNGYGYFDLKADGKYYGSDEAFAMSIVEQIIREAHEGEETLIAEEEAEIFAEAESSDADAMPYSAADPAAQIELIADAMPGFAWVGGGVGFVKPEEAEAIRSGKPYRLMNIDILRLRDLRGGAAIDGSPDTDPFIIAMLARGYIRENPDYTRYTELERQAKAQGKGFNVKWSDTMDVYIGFGGSNLFRRWTITDAGRTFANNL